MCKSKEALVLDRRRDALPSNPFIPHGALPAAPWCLIRRQLIRRESPSRRGHQNGEHLFRDFQSIKRLRVCKQDARATLIHHDLPHKQVIALNSCL